MSSLASEDHTSTLLPSVTRVAGARVELGPLPVVLAALIVFVLSLITVGCNSIILAAFYRYKRLRTASNCLLVSLAVSDFGVGVFMPFGTYLELAEPSEPSSGGGAAGLRDASWGPPSSLCVAPYCILIALCSVSVLVTVAIAVDRLTSLAQPLRYKNIITHSSIEKYIAVFWLYATAVGLSPIIYAKLVGTGEVFGYDCSGSCRFNGVIMPPVRVFLFLAVWAPSALILLGCYVYVYLVARAHARAIYTVELSFRNQTQTLALPRYGQTLAVTVGAFFILWLPFQACMLLDIFCGTNILSDCTIWLGLPILAHSGTNPWIYAFHHGEMRIAAGKIAEDIVSLFGVTPSRYGCSPTRRGSNANLELAEVNNSNEERRPPIEDCFAAKHQTLVFSSRKCVELSSKLADVSSENAERGSSTESYKEIDIAEENIHDLTKMLDPKYAIDRSLVIDLNHNIDKIKNLKYLLDPTFDKIRLVRRLNHKRTADKNMQRFRESRFVSYQNLKSDGTLCRKTTVHLNTMSDPILNIESSVTSSKTVNETIGQYSAIFKKKVSALSSASDSNIKDSVDTSDPNLRLFHPGTTVIETHDNSEQSIDKQYVDRGFMKNLQNQQIEHHRRSFSWARARRRFTSKYFESSSQTLDLKFQQASYTSLPTPDGARSSSRSSPKNQSSVRHLTIIPNRLANLFYHEPTLRPSIKIESDIISSKKDLQLHKNLEQLQYFYSTNTFHESIGQVRLPKRSRLTDSLTVPTIHSEPPSPIDPPPLGSLQEEEYGKSAVEFSLNERLVSPLSTAQPVPQNVISPTRHSDPVIPSVLLNIEDYSEHRYGCQNAWSTHSPVNVNCGSISPKELSNILLRCMDDQTIENNKFTDTIFPEHDSTRFSSRRPSDSKWSESSRSQEILSNVTEHPKFPSSFSVNNFQTFNSGSDLNDLTSCLDPFMCSDALSSSLRESFFSAPSVPDSEDIFTSFETDEPTPEKISPKTQYSSSSINLVKKPVGLHQDLQLEVQSKSTESMFRNKEQSKRLCAFFRLEPSIHRSRPKFRVVTCKNLRLAPLATPTPTDVCTPTFDITVLSDIKAEGGLSVKV